MERFEAGLTLWEEWQGEGFEPEYPESTVLYTPGHVDLDNDFVRGSLVRALTRSGVAERWSDANKAVENATVRHGHAGMVDEDVYLVACDSSGMTFYGDEVEKLRAVTWVEVDVDG